MNTDDKRTQASDRPATRRLVPWLVVIVLAVALLAAMPGAWALPSQSPDFQTVPTLTPTPTRPGAATSTPGPGGPTNTPVPGPGGPTDTPAPGQPTSTPVPGVTPTATPTRLAGSGVPVLPANCWTVPTPGFAAQRTEDIDFVAESAQFLVVPGQQVSLAFVVTNNSDAALTDVLVCAPLEAILERGAATASEGDVRLVADGLIFELAELGPGDSVRTEVKLTIPVDTPLGGVIENQAWLFADGLQVSTDLLTWALPPSYLPPTGR